MSRHVDIAQKDLKTKKPEKSMKKCEKHEKMCCPLSFQSGIDYKPLSKEELEKQKWKWH